jgi:hypothetical protein
MSYNYIKQLALNYSQVDDSDRELADEENESIRLCCGLFHHTCPSTEVLSTSQQYRRIRACH